MNTSATPFTLRQMKHLEEAFRLGAADASQAMARWLEVPSLITIESIDQLPIDEAPGILGSSDAPLCFCSMAMTGGLTGMMIFAFDDACGFSLTDLLLNHPLGTAREWGEVECSAALESTNIIGCSYLNSLARHLPESLELVPSPPLFRREFAGSLLQAAFMDQAMAANFIFLARARFEIRGEPLNWSLLFVPDAPSLARLSQMFPASDEAGYTG